MAGERCSRCGLPSSRDYVDGEAFCFHGTGRDSDKLACRDRELRHLRARLTLAEAVIEAADRMRESGCALSVAVPPLKGHALRVLAQFNDDRADYHQARAALQAFDRAANAEPSGQRAKG